MSNKAHRKMVTARSDLVLEHPFFAHLALRLELKEDFRCSSAWSDGRVLAYNPNYIDTLPLEKVKGVQCHEVLHLVCCHHTRRKGRDPALWNKACDLAINPVLLEAGIELPEGYFYDASHQGKSAEAIYSHLVDREEEIRGGATGGQEEEVAAPEKQEADVASGQSREQPDAPGQDSGEQEDMQGEGLDPGMSGEVKDAPINLDETANADDALRQEEESWRMSLADALHKGREAGELPGGLERLFGELVSPALSWREILRRFLEHAAKNDFSWVVPDRRHLHAGLYLPSLHNNELAEVAVAVDVSGSITQQAMDAFAAELSAVLEEFDTSLTVFTCDAALTTEKRLCTWDLPLDFTVTGGGGTDFRPPFERLGQQGVHPACLIYFTDLESDRFPQDPGFPVLWVTPGLEHTLPPFGEVVVMEQSQ